MFSVAQKIINTLNAMAKKGCKYTVSRVPSFIIIIIIIIITVMYFNTLYRHREFIDNIQDYRKEGYIPCYCMQLLEVVFKTILSIEDKS